MHVPFFFCELSSQHRGLTADASGGNNKDANGPIDYALDMIGNGGGGGECVRVRNLRYDSLRAVCACCATHLPNEFRFCARQLELME